jgi:hypothetical protein
VQFPIQSTGSECPCGFTIATCTFGVLRFAALAPPRAVPSSGNGPLRVLCTETHHDSLFWVSSDIILSRCSSPTYCSTYCYNMRERGAGSRKFRNIRSAKPKWDGLTNVRYWSKSRRHPLKVSISQFGPKADVPSCSFLSRNEFRLREANEQLRNCISGHGFAE